MEKPHSAQRGGVEATRGLSYASGDMPRSRGSLSPPRVVQGDASPRGVEEKQFSDNLEELKREEENARKEIEKAGKRREEIIARAKEEAARMLEETQAEVSKEKEQMIEEEVKELEKQATEIVQKAQKEAGKIGKSADPKKIAEKLLPLIFK